MVTPDIEKFASGFITDEYNCESMQLTDHILMTAAVLNNVSWCHRANCYNVVFRMMHDGESFVFVNDVEIGLIIHHVTHEKMVQAIIFALATFAPRCIPASVRAMQSSISDDIELKYLICGAWLRAVCVRMEKLAKFLGSDCMVIDFWDRSEFGEPCAQCLADTGM